MTNTALQKTAWMRRSSGTKAPPMYYVDDDGNLHFREHAGQEKALDSTARFILVLAGLQSGKTVTGPWWLAREMALRGPGDYLAAGPTFPLLTMKCMPEYEALFERRLQWGKLYKGYPPILELNDLGKRSLFGRVQDAETRIIFGAGIKPESLESATVKAAHLDEAGQRQFLRASHEAVLGRLSVHRGRILYTSTPYVLGWLKNEVFDRAKRDAKKPPLEREYELVQFESTMNPAFPKEEFEDMRSKLPGWKFNMRYRGLFERPAGMIYDAFDEGLKVSRFTIPPHWERFLGFDFGGVNTAVVYLAAEEIQGKKTGRYFAYRTYKAGNRTAAEHKAAILSADKDLGVPAEPRLPNATGGSWSEDHWRREYKAAGLPIKRPPINDVEVGIDRVYGLFKQRKLFVFDDLLDLLDEIESYSRVLDDNDEPTEKIEDKNQYHLLDGLRYDCAGLVQKKKILKGADADF